MFSTIHYKSGWIHCSTHGNVETILATVTVEHCGTIENLRCECASVASAKRWITKNEKVAVA